MKDYSYIKVSFYNKDIKVFKDITKSLCTSDDLYYSDIVSSICGDVSSKLHYTLFYGLADCVNRQEIGKYIKSIQLPELQLGKLFLMPGWQKQYQILCIEVLDPDNKLKQISDSFKQFVYVEKVQYPDFIPHITLAFVNVAYILKATPEIPTSLKIKEIKFIKK
jgi:2'-5' RNA ligase